MGTRADFYIGKNPETMEYLGSIAWDGYPDGIPKNILKAKTARSWRNAILRFLADREDASLPERDGWPWPWSNSHTTAHSYTYQKGVWRTVIDNHAVHRWTMWSENDECDPACLEKAEFPDMTAIQKVTFGKRSGLIIFPPLEETP